MEIKIIEVEVFVMCGEKYVGGKATGEFGFFRVSDIYKVVKFSPKANYHLPLFFTRHGEYSFPTTIEACREILEPYGILQLDSPNLININNVVEIDDRFGRASVIFENGLEGNVSWRNKKLIEDFLKNKSERDRG